MTYTFGSIPSNVTFQDVNDNYVFGKNEVGRISGQEFWTEVKATIPMLTDEQFANKYVAEVKAKGGTVIYVRVSSNMRMVPSTNVPNMVFRVEECYFVADPLAIAQLVIIGLAIIIGGFTLNMYFHPEILQKVLGINPDDASKYADAANKAKDIPSNYIWLILAVAVLFFVFFGGSIGRGGVKARGKR